jgi:hypothetical protein
VSAFLFCQYFVFLSFHNGLLFNFLLSFLCLHLAVTVAVWLVRDCGLFTYQVTANFGAGYCAQKTTETLINYTACCVKFYPEMLSFRIGSSISHSSFIFFKVSPAASKFSERISFSSFFVRSDKIPHLPLAVDPFIE